MDHLRWDKLWINANICTMNESYSTPYGLLTHSAIATKNNKIAWIGAMNNLPSQANICAKEVFDVQNKLLTPGLIDCHTHVVYASNRAHEFEMRLNGVSYEEIAKKGGGIQSTVTATRAISEDELFEQSVKRVQKMMLNNVTTIEIKSGYGLNLETELKMLRVAKRIAQEVPIEVYTTFLGAHSIPNEYYGKSDEYIDYVCQEMVPTVAQQNLADAVDVFCEKIAFSLKQTEKVFQTAQKYNLKIKCHSEQLSNLGSAQLAAEYNALSVDHLEYLSEDGVKTLAKSKTVAVLLPGAFYFLREKQYPPIGLLRKHNVPIAIATDHNPGTSPTTSLPLMMNMACTLFKLTTEEALAGVTKHAAKALGIEKTHGTLEVGKIDHISMWNYQHPAELSYNF